MPNWVINKVKFNCDHDKFMEIVKDISCEDCFGLIDFNKVIPMPESEEANWYHWCIENWGTKWNARLNTSLNFNDDDTVILFVTAWSTPEPIIYALSKRYPDIDIVCEFADEDIGYNCGRYGFKNGNDIVEVFYEGNGKREDIKFANELWGC